MSEPLKIQVQAVNRRGKNRKARAQPEPTAIQRQYIAEINGLVDQYADIVESILFPALEMAASEARLSGVRADGWVDDIDSALNRITVKLGSFTGAIKRRVGAIGEQLGLFNQRNFKQIVNSTIGVNVMLNEPWLNEELAAWSAQNVRLVSSVPDQAHTNISRLALEGVRSGKSVRSIEAEIRDTYGIAKKRAKTIARTETAKLNSELTERRQREIGISTYYWRTSRDERVRTPHKVLNGKLCRWDDPTVYSDDGGKTWKKRSSIGGYIGHVGTDYACRCSSSANTEQLLERLGI